MSHDITEDAFLVANQRGVIVDANEAGCRLLGRPREEILGLSLAPHSPPEILVPLGMRWSELQSKGTIRGSIKIERPDGMHEQADFVAQRDLPVMGWTLVRLSSSVR